MSFDENKYLIKPLEDRGVLKIVFNNGMETSYIDFASWEVLKGTVRRRLKLHGVPIAINGGGKWTDC